MGAAPCPAKLTLQAVENTANYSDVRAAQIHVREKRFSSAGVKKVLSTRSAAFRPQSKFDCVHALANALAEF